MSPNDKNFFGLAAGMLASMCELLPPGHHITLIIRHEFDENSGLVITSETTERPGAIEVIEKALRRGLNKAPAMIIETKKIPPSDPSSN